MIPYRDQNPTELIPFVNAFYVLAGLGGAGAQILAGPEAAVPIVGASGAVAGIMGGYILLYPTSRIHTWIFPIFFVRLPAFLLLGTGSWCRRTRAGSPWR